MSTWRRHSGDSTWHDGREDGGSFVTLCHGRWPLADEQSGQVEHSEKPPHDERCDACQRERIEQRRIERGLAELGEASTQDWPGVHELFDLGGES